MKTIQNARQRLDMIKESMMLTVFDLPLVRTDGLVLLSIIFEA